jgi:hypothetical protein
MREFLKIYELYGYQQIGGEGKTRDQQDTKYMLC